MEKLKDEYIEMIKVILTLSKATFFQCSGLKRFSNNVKFDEELKKIKELETLFNNNEIYFKKEEV